MPGQAISTGKPYITIVGGNIVQKVSKDTPNAVLREYELPDKTKGSKYELVFMNWEGTIQNITFKETNYGDMCNIELEDAILSLNTESRYFQDLACKLFSGDITKPFLFHPYDMEVDGKRKSGISLQQDGEKLKNYFYDGEKNLHGFPEVDEEKSSKKTYWKVYFIEVAEFLVEKLKELKFVEPIIEDEPTPESNTDELPDVDEMPF